MVEKGQDAQRGAFLSQAQPKGPRPPLKEVEKIARALARASYETGTVRLIERELSGLTHLVATRRGLFGVNGERHVLLAHGAFFGLTLRDASIFVFEACDLAPLPTVKGRIVRFDRTGDRIAAATVIATGLDNGCHQIDFIDGRLTVLDTQNQRILRFDSGEAGYEALYPLPRLQERSWSNGYVHVNALLQVEDRILLLLHNGAHYTGRASEIAVFDRDWHELERWPLPGHNCHNIVVLEDGALLSCGSDAGEIIGLGGPLAKVSDLMTRGLSVGAESIVVGASKFSARVVRHRVPGTVTFLDRSFQPHAVLQLPAAPADIRRLDGQDLGLSAFAAGRVRFPRPPAGGIPAQQ